jgi:hypothetical protein
MCQILLKFSATGNNRNQWGSGELQAWPETGSKQQYWKGMSGICRSALLENLINAY